MGDRIGWIPDRAEYFSIKQTRGGRGLEIEFFRPQDLTDNMVGKVRNVSQLPALLRKVDESMTPAELQLVSVKAEFEFIIKRIDADGHL